MGMTITEKILAKAVGKEKVVPGELVDAKIDIVLCVDVTTPPAISMLEDKGIDKVFDAERIVVTPDHFQPAKDIKSAELHKRLDGWAKRPTQYKILLQARQGRGMSRAAAGAGTYSAG
jgi:3-isopropylmalate/(R)-2-methylmalate dehydratase large subunit